MVNMCFLAFLGLSRVGRKATSIKRNRLRRTNVHNVQMKTVKIACFRAVVSVLYMLRKEKKKEKKIYPFFFANPIHGCKCHGR